MNGREVLIIGGKGYFGRLLAEDLRTHAGIVATIGGRSGPIVADLRDRDSLEATLRHIAVVICAAGPYQTMPTTLPELCIRRGIHYIDLSDDRDFVNKVRTLVPIESDNLPAICSGWSTVPALSGLLTQIGIAGQHRVDSIHIHMTAGSRGARNRATIESLMHSVGQRFTLFRDGQATTVLGGSEPRAFVFPPPIGKRNGFLVNVPDLNLFPNLFQARTVEFRAGSELWILNAAVSALAQVARTGLVKDWVFCSGFMRQAAAMLSGLGHDWGAVGVEVHGALARRVSVIAEQNAPRIAVMPASVMTAAILSGEDIRGWVSPANWITPGRLRDECRKRGFQLIVEEL